MAGGQAQNLSARRAHPLELSVWIHKTVLEVEQLRQAYDAYLATAKVRWQ